MKSRSKVLIVAGSDSSGGAGIQADIKTISSLGSYAMTAITAITSQNTTGVKSVFPINHVEVEKQIRFTCKDIKPNAIKVGMLHSSKIINSVFYELKKFNDIKIVLDPVMVAKNGTKLIDKGAIKNLKKKLLSISYLITPNIPEAEVLTNVKIKDTDDMIIVGKILLKMGAKNVLIKGGHSKASFIEDVLITDRNINIFRNKKIKTKNTHGTGCTLSSAIATFLSCGKPLKKSCELGIKYVNQAIKFNRNYGKGHGPINHLNSIKIKKIFV